MNINTYENLSPIEKRYLITIDKYFTTECSTNNITLMINIIEGTSNISLRILDWFVTTYAYNNVVSYDIIDEKGQKKNINVNMSYKAQLKTYHKKYFDPFKRQTDIIKKQNIKIIKKQNNKIKYNILGKTIETKICQLNFFKWAFENHIINYVKNNLQIIIESMNNYKISHSSRKSKIKSKKSTETTYSAFTNLSTGNTTAIKISFV